MKCTTNPVATEVLDNLEAVCLRSSLDCSADTIDGLTSAGLLHGLLKGRAGGMAQARLLRVGRGHKFRSSGIGEVASQLSRNIDVQYVACSNHSITWDAVCRLLVDADA